MFAKKAKHEEDPESPTEAPEFYGIKRKKPGEDGANNMRRMSDRFVCNAKEAQGQAAGRASWTSGDQVRSRRATKKPAYTSTSSSSPDEFQVPPDFLAPPGSKSKNMITQPPANSATTQPASVSPRTAVSLYGQKTMFPPSPPAPLFWPTLSPAPANVERATGSLMRSIKDKRKSRLVSAPPRMHSLEQGPFASSLHLPLVEELPPPRAPPQKPRGLTIRNSVPTQFSSSENGSAPEAVGLSPIVTATESRRVLRNSAAIEKSTHRPEHSLVADNALEFRCGADESLAPSESASAQPPDYNGDPRPNFWKTADQSLAARRDTAEEWIAGLPGLGLGSHDGALDWKCLQSLKAKNELKRSRSGLSSTSSHKTENTEGIEENRNDTRSGDDAEQGLTRSLPGGSRSPAPGVSALSMAKADPGFTEA